MRIKHYATYEMLELNVEKLRRANTKIVRLQKSKSCSFSTIRMVLFIMNTWQDKIVNGDYYLGVMKRLLIKISLVRSQYRTQRSWSLLHDNVPTHKCIVVHKFLASKLALNHSPYSSDLTSCDYFLFLKLKMKLKEKQFDIILNIQKTPTKVISTMSKKDFQWSFLKLYNRCCKTNIVSSERMYFE